MALVYLHRNPRPIATPVASHQPSEPPPRRSSARQHAAIARVQQNTEGASMVINSEPAVKSGVTLSINVSHAAAPSP